MKKDENGRYSNRIVDWFANKSYAYKGIIIGVIFAAALGGYLIHSYVTTERYDYTILMATETQILYTQYMQLGEEMEKYAKDVDGNGEINIKVDYCYMNKDSSPNEYMAGVTRFSGIAGTDGWRILIADEPTLEMLRSEGYTFVSLSDMGASGDAWSWEGSALYKEVNELYPISTPLYFCFIEKEPGGKTSQTAEETNRQLLKNIIMA